MESIIEPIDRSILKAELTSDKFVRITRKGEHEIYIVNHHNAPNVVREIGRLREVTFRNSGGGTGLSVDLDEFDTNDHCYEQLIVWSPEDEEIIGGYRFILCGNAILKNEIALSTTHYFNFSKHFVDDYLPHTIELGRSWVQPNYQPNINYRKGLYALDNIWDGLGALIIHHPKIKYFFGKVTMYPTYERDARDFLLLFLNHFFPDTEKLVTPIHPLKVGANKPFEDLKKQNLEYKEAYRILNAYVRDKGEVIPPLVNIYMNLSSTMKTFGTAVNPDFGNVEETGIIVTIRDIYPEKKERHMMGDFGSKQ
ncbi:MAG: GNAT family N-acetyltransferase [Crocinitomicaceae bacterium]|nr:GNAT family N-acetyltransferase [Crocinitomicaceae bacterium]